MISAVFEYLGQDLSEHRNGILRGVPRWLQEASRKRARNNTVRQSDIHLSLSAGPLGNIVVHRRTSIGRVATPMLAGPVPSVESGAGPVAATRAG